MNPNPFKRKLTTEQELKLVEKYKEGETKSKLAKDFHIQRNTVINILERHGIERQGKVDNTHLKGAVTARRKDTSLPDHERTFQAIALYFNQPETNIQRWCKNIDCDFNGNVKYTQDQRDLACKLRLEGKEKKDIEKATGIKIGTQTVLYHEKGIKLTKEQKHENRIIFGEDARIKAWELRDDFYSLGQISSVLKCGLFTAKALLKDYKIPPEKLKYYLAEYTAEQEFQVIELRRKGVSAKEIAEIVQIKDVETVRRISYENGIVLTKDQRILNRIGSTKYTWESVVMACEGKQIEPHLKSGPILGRMTNEDNSLPFKCLACKKEDFYPRIHDVLYGRVGSCGCLASSPEEEIRQYIGEWLGYECPRDKRVLEGREIDIYIEEKAVGIEFCGLYWHSDARTDQDEGPNFAEKRHEYKYLKCKEKGVRLITVFEDEYFLRPQAVLSYIKTIVGAKTSKSVGAREVQIVRNPPNYREFLDKYHIQGTGAYGTAYGLSWKGEIMAVMVFRKTQGAPEGHYDLTRFCLGETGVMGGFSKLLKAFVKDYSPVKITTFSDNRWSEGELYKNNGFELESLVRRDYFYVRGRKDIRMKKDAFEKANLKDLYPELYSDDKTEEQIMKEAGWNRIWDCGKKKWVLKL